MKTGAGEDPFADEEDDEPREDAAGGRDRSERTGRTPAGRDGRATGDSGGGDPTDDASTEGEPVAAGDASERVQPSELPFIARRNARGDNVKAGRETRRLFELRPDVAEKEASFMDELARRLGDDVPKTDAREAALAVVYDRPGLVADKLEEWGINYFEE